MKSAYVATQILQGDSDTAVPKSQADVCDVIKTIHILLTK
jgi:hypothetical protein